MKVLSFDPGGTTSGKNKAAATGWCYQENNGQGTTKVFGTGPLYSTADLHKFLKEWDVSQLPVDVVVYESYTVRPDPKGVSANVGKRMITSEAIGSITMWASFNNVKVQSYDAKLKPVQGAHSGFITKGKTKRFTHGMDAFNHGWWHLYQCGLVKTALELRLGV